MNVWLSALIIVAGLFVGVPWSIAYYLAEKEDREND